MISVPVQIDRLAPTSVRSQIVEAYAHAIRDGQLEAGVALPSVRGLSRRLGISPVTVAAAYRELCEAGLATARPRSGYRVAGAISYSAERPVFQLNRIEPDLRIHPVADCARLISAVAAVDPRCGGYAEYRGEPELRRAIAELDRTLSVEAEPEAGMLITSGAQQALSLLGRSLSGGVVVAVEDPCYPGARLAFSSAGAVLMPVPVGEDGPEEAALRSIAEPGKVAAFYCCPTHANPTGRSWSEAARRRVLCAARQGGTLLVEDDYLGDLDAPGEAPPRLAALAADYPGVRVLRIHTFSKTLMPALRLASVAGEPQLINRLLSLKIADDLGCSAFLQRALARFIASGDYGRHLERVRPRYRQVHDALREAIARVGAGFSFAGGVGGMCMLGQVDPGIDVSRFISECARLGVLLMPGTDYWFNALRGGDSFRMGFGSLAPSEVPAVFAALEKAAGVAAAGGASDKWSLL